MPGSDATSKWLVSGEAKVSRSFRNELRTVVFLPDNRLSWNPHRRAGHQNSLGASLSTGQPQQVRLRPAATSSARFHIGAKSRDRASVGWHGLDFLSSVFGILQGCCDFAAIFQTRFDPTAGRPCHGWQPSSLRARPSSWWVCVCVCVCLWMCLRLCVLFAGVLWEGFSRAQSQTC